MKCWQRVRCEIESSIKVNGVCVKKGASGSYQSAFDSSNYRRHEFQTALIVSRWNLNAFDRARNFKGFSEFNEKERKKERERERERVLKAARH